MSRPSDDIHEFDSIARGLHDEAVAQLPWRVREQLRRARLQPQLTSRAYRPVPGWMLATACAAVLAVTVGIAIAPRAPAPASETPLAGKSTNNNDSPYGDALATLDEDPDFYLWLATTSVQPLAME